MGFKSFGTAVSLLFCCAVSAHATPGDVNGDGVVSPADAVLASRMVAGYVARTVDQFEAADIAGPAGDIRDGYIDQRDVARITRIAGGLEPAPDSPVRRLMFISDTFTLTGDGSRDYAFPVAPDPTGETFLVHGHISNLPPGTRSNLITFVQLRSGGYSSVGAFADATGDYRISLAPAEYQLYSDGAVSEAHPEGNLQWDYSVSLNRSVTVNGPMTLDIAAAPAPAPGQVSGEVHATNIVPKALQATPPFPAFPPSVDPTAPRRPISGLLIGDSYLFKGMPSAYSPQFDAVYGPDPSITYNWNPGETLTISGGSATGPAYTLPTAVPVSFNVALPANTSLYSATLTNRNSSGSLGLATSSQLSPDSSVYSTAFAPGPARLQLSLRLNGTGNAEAILHRVVEPTIPADGGEQSVSLPPVPALVRYSGRVTYPNGAPAVGARVSVRSMVDSRNPTPPYEMLAYAATDNDGRFSIKVLPGYSRIYIPVP